MSTDQYLILLFVGLSVLALVVLWAVTVALIWRHLRVLQRRVHDLLKRMDRLQESLDRSDLRGAVDALLVDVRADVEWVSQALMAHLAHGSAEASSRTP